MGHKVNPQQFRLGISVDWKYQLRDPLLANIFIHKLVKNLATNYSAPYTSYKVRRNVNPRADINYFSTDQEITDIFLHKKMMIANPFLDSSFIFSHLNISYAPSLYLAIFFLDGSAEHTRIKANIPEISFYYLSGKSYKQSKYFHSYFKKNIFLKPSNQRRRSLNTSFHFHHRFLLDLILDRPQLELNDNKHPILINILTGISYKLQKTKKIYNKVYKYNYDISKIIKKHEAYRKVYKYNYNILRIRKMHKAYIYAKGTIKQKKRNFLRFYNVFTRIKQTIFNKLKTHNKRNRHLYKVSYIKKYRKLYKTRNKKQFFLKKRVKKKKRRYSLEEIQADIPRLDFLESLYPVYKQWSRRYKYIRLWSHIKVEDKVFPSWLMNCFPYHFYEHYFNDAIKHIRILKYLIRYFKFYKRIFSKKRLFFFNILIVCLSSLLMCLSFKNNGATRSVKNRLGFFLYLCYIYLVSFRYTHFQYNKQIFSNNFLFFRYFSKIITFSLKKVAFFPTDNKVIIRFYALHNKNLNASFLVNYFKVKLSQYFILSDILNPVLYRLKGETYVKGFRLIFSGRLTRKERAAFIVRSFGSMPLSTYHIKVDYAADYLIMKFGVVGIKVSLYYDRVPPYYYFFEFRNKL